MPGKSAEAFRTISEAAAEVGVEAHVLRFWETKFTQVKPVKRAGNRRYYRARDVALLGGIRRLLRDEGMTIKGVQRTLREKGVGHVAALVAEAPAEPAAEAPRPAAETPIDALVRAAIPEDVRLVLRPARPRMDPGRPLADRAAVAAAFARLEAIRARL